MRKSNTFELLSLANPSFLSDNHTTEIEEKKQKKNQHSLNSLCKFKEHF